MNKLTALALFASSVVVLNVPPTADALPVLELSKSIDNSTPMVNEPVEFTIEVVNTGDTAALDVQVRDLLPPELVIPSGMAAFAASGDFIPATGLWSVGDLDPGASSTLTLPAMLSVEDPPSCVVNIATATFAGATIDDEVSARTAIRRIGTEHCVDLDADFDIRVGDLLVQSCDHMDRYYGYVDVNNFGPDTARNVVVSISQTPVVAPNLRFDDAACENPPALYCEIPEIPAGQTVSINVTSDLFLSHAEYEQTISVLAVTTDIDYEPSNDNPSNSRTAGGFSACLDFDINVDLPFEFTGPGCFIATAAFGSALHPHVDRLRDFRDRVLLPHRVGRAFVDFYYRHSPPIAAYIVQRPWLRAIVRWLLAPLVYGVAYPGIALSLLAMLLAQGARVCHRRQRRLRARICTEGGPLTG